MITLPNALEGVGIDDNIIGLDLLVISIIVSPFSTPSARNAIVSDSFKLIP